MENTIINYEKLIIKTLGPKGSTSEHVASNYLCLNCHCGSGKVMLYDSFENSFLDLHIGELLIVPSAYNKIEQFF
jgi:hypothetical protein